MAKKKYENLQPAICCWWCPCSHVGHTVDACSCCHCPNPSGHTRVFARSPAQRLKSWISRCCDVGAREKTNYLYKHVYRKCMSKMYICFSDIDICVNMCIYMFMYTTSTRKKNVLVQPTPELRITTRTTITSHQHQQPQLAQPKGHLQGFNWFCNGTNAQSAVQYTLHSKQMGNMPRVVYRCTSVYMYVFVYFFIYLLIKLYYTHIHI